MVFNPKSLTLLPDGELRLGSGDVPIDEPKRCESDDPDGESLFETLDWLYRPFGRLLEERALSVLGRVLPFWPLAAGGKYSRLRLAASIDGLKRPLKLS